MLTITTTDTAITHETDTRRNRPVLAPVRPADGLEALDMGADTPQSDAEGEEEANGEAETPDAFLPDTAEKVDWVLGKIAAARGEANLIRSNMELMAREHDRAADALEWKFGPALQTWLRAELEGGKKKSKRLPHGVLGYRTKPAGVSVTDDAAALAWAQENATQAVTIRLDKKALAEALLETGESVDFAAFMPEEQTFYIK